MTGIDIGIIGIVAISTIISFIRGFFTEAVSLATWLVALLIATLYAHQFGSLFREQIPDAMARGVLAWVILFVGTLLIGALINYLVSKLRATVRLSAIDRIVGLFFGLGRGLLLVALIVLAAHLAFFTSLRDGELWNTSMLLPHFVQVARILHGFLPLEEGRHFDFNVDVI